MLYPYEEDDLGELYLECKTCDFREQSSDPVISTNNIVELEEEKKIDWEEIPSDVTLYRNFHDSCRSEDCGGSEVVMYIVQYEKKVNVYSVCATCHYKWKETQ